MLADNISVGIRQIQRTLDTHRVEFLACTATNTPNIIDRKRRHQLTLAFPVREVHYAARLLLPLFGRMVRQLREGFGGRNTYADEQMCALVQRVSNFTSKRRQIAAIHNPREIAKRLIN
ncbi:hypothetical protein D3C81_1587820 [compost metagenome]